ncbi:cysteine-rich CWC family protein [Glaciimonas immobilis]|uniref:cysteine-rich CWC family protein n=1 Tax=Glaciimonas immobilis TaxID=728004 RepID=UPI0035D3FB60
MSLCKQQFSCGVATGCAVDCLEDCWCQGLPALMAVPTASKIAEPVNKSACFCPVCLRLLLDCITLTSTP